MKTENDNQKTTKGLLNQVQFNVKDFLRGESNFPELRISTVTTV